MAKATSKTKPEISLTPKKEPNDYTGAVIWSIRNVEPETRRVMEKASDRVGKTLGQYLNEDVRAFAQSQLTQSQLPASPKNIQDQIDHLTKLIEAMIKRPEPEKEKKSIWRRFSR